MANIDIIKVQEIQNYRLGGRRNSGGVVCLQMWLTCSIYRLKTGPPRRSAHQPPQLRGWLEKKDLSGCLAAARQTLRSCEGYWAATMSARLVTLPSSQFDYGFFP